MEELLRSKTSEAKFLKMRRPGSIVLSLLPYLAVIIVSLPFVIVGFPDGHDSSYGLVRAAEFKYSLFNGQFPPYWAENLYGGYGSPIFLFYAPLYLLVSTMCSLLAGSIAGGMMLALVLFSLAAIFGVKLMLQEVLGRHTLENQAALRVGVYFFLLNPYLIGDLFRRNAYSEYSALCISPFAVYGLLQIRSRPCIGGLILATSLALIILAHNLTALVITALVLAAALIIYPPFEHHLSWRIITANIGLSLGLSAFFWVPAIYYLPLVRNEQNVTGKFDFHNNFPALRNLFGYEEFFSTGLLIPLVLLIAASILLFSPKKRDLPHKRLFLFAFGCSLLFLFLQTRLSLLVWETVPYMPYFQFPWRMMGPLALVASIVLGMSFAHLHRGSSRGIVLFREVAVLLLCIVNAIPQLREARPVPWEISRQFTTMLDPQNIRKLGLSATYSDEYLPRVADPNAWRSARPMLGPIVRTKSGIGLKILKDSGTNIYLETDASGPTSLELARWFFPEWKCAVNGEACKLGLNKTGSLDVSIPPGSNRIVLELFPPALRRLAVWVSLASLAAWLWIVIVVLGKRNKTSLVGRAVANEVRS
jgi:hypothetical protein